MNILRFPILSWAILLTVIMTSSCKKYEEATYDEIMNGLQTTFVGTQNGDGTGSFFDTEVHILPAGDSSIMVVGMFYDSLIVKVKSIDYTNGHLLAVGDSIDHFTYIDKDETLDIIKQINKYPFFTFSGKSKN